jgi:glycosyltransferase involved in cell wall biosynthesis
MSALVSIVIPAHNEAAVLSKNLRHLLDRTSPGEFDVIVVANACTDRTADIARAEAVRVLESPAPGKVGAIRLGDQACLTFPRIYLDADVELSSDSVRALLAAVTEPAVLAAAPVPVLDLAGVSGIARRMHRVHEALVGPSRALAGVGVYVLTEAGHRRVFPMPDVISDDGWVHNSFSASERVVVRTATSRVRPPRTLRAHVRRRVRVRLGNQQLAALGRPAPQGPLGLGSLAALVRRGTVGPLDAAAYAGVKLVERFMTPRRKDKPVAWSGDTTTRTPSSSTVD